MEKPALLNKNCKSIFIQTTNNHNHLSGHIKKALCYLHTDHLGSTVLMTDDEGDSVGSSGYKPYGDPESASGDVATDIKFTGQRLDQTGLYFYNARYYDAVIGRFVSPDTLVLIRLIHKRSIGKAIALMIPSNSQMKPGIFGTVFSVVLSAR